MLIGLIAPAGSGKSKVARRLKRRYDFKRLRAGQPLKDAARALGLSKYETDGAGKDKPSLLLAGAAPRSVMEPISDDVAKAAPHLTAARLRPRITKALNAGQHVVVDGVRQDAEAALIHKLGGRLVSIDAGKAPDPNKPMDLRAAKLVADHVIKMSGSRKERHAAIDAMLAKCMTAE